MLPPGVRDVECPLLMGGVAPRIAAVLCTYNRARLLESALESLAAQTLERSHYEIVVVDNHSTDGTVTVVADFQARHVTLLLTLINEPRQGLSYARNSGWARARADIVAFLDDDMIAPPDWLRSILECFDRIEPQPWGVGGPIFPHYESEKPAWFKDEYESSTWGGVSRFLTPGESFSGNMAFRKDVLDRYGGFHVGLGMSGTRLSVAEETALYERAWELDGFAPRFYYCRQALNYHRIPPSKMTVRYRLRRSFAEGQAWPQRHVPRSLSARLAAVARTVARLVKTSFAASLRLPRHSFWQQWLVEDGCSMASEIGSLMGYFGLTIPVSRPSDEWPRRRRA